MTPINYNHLYYFYRVAVDGGITAASRNLHLTPQTISGQITAFEQHIGYPLFERQGKKLALTQRGRMVMSYAEDIFHLGDELRALLKQPEIVERLSVSVGIVDVIPKALAYALIKPVNSLPQPVHLVCREGNLEHLLAELAVNKLDVVLSERPIPPGTRLRAYNHLVVETDIALFGTPMLIKPYQSEFPGSLTGAPLLMPSAQTLLSQLLAVSSLTSTDLASAQKRRPSVPLRTSSRLFSPPAMVARSTSAIFQACCWRSDSRPAPPSRSRTTAASMT